MGKSKIVSVGKLNFPRQKDAIEHFQRLIAGYRPGERVSDQDFDLVRELLNRHSDAPRKVGAGVSHFEVREADYGTHCFYVVRVDGTSEKFSFHHCITGR